MLQSVMVIQTFSSVSRNLIGAVMSPESISTSLTSPELENSENAIM